jgi:hypothetical protein
MRLSFLLVLLALSSCTMAGRLHNLQAWAAWADQPSGARSAFLRCAYEVSETQCGTSDIRNPVAERCLQMQVSEYREAENKFFWLVEKGCDRSRAAFRAGEI